MDLVDISSLIADHKNRVSQEKILLEARKYSPNPRLFLNHGISHISNESPKSNALVHPVEFSKGAGDNSRDEEEFFLTECNNNFEEEHFPNDESYKTCNSTFSPNNSVEVFSTSVNHQSDEVNAANVQSTQKSLVVNRKSKSPLSKENPIHDWTSHETCSDPSMLLTDEKLNFKVSPSSKVGITLDGVSPGEKSVFNREQEIERLAESLSSLSFWDNFGESATAKKWKPTFDESMVRVGEFSPSNPNLQTPGKALLGLGEYEERRKQLLERKKQEYRDYLAQGRNMLYNTEHNLNNNSSFLGSPSTRRRASTSQENFDHIKNTTSPVVDAATQTDFWTARPNALEFGVSSKPDADYSQSVQTMLLSTDQMLHPLSPREKHNLELTHHNTPSFVQRSHISQTTEQLPDTRLRQLQHQEELRQQIEEKRRFEAERKERERIEEEALQKRVAEQQARLQAEYEQEERARREREAQKQQQVEEFQRRQEELRLESQQLKQEERRRKQEAAATARQMQEQQRGRHTHLVKSSSPTLSPRHLVAPEPSALPRLPDQLPQPEEEDEYLYPPSPKALIKVLEGPTGLDDSLPIPLMPTSRRSLHSSPQRSHDRSPRRSPRQSPHRTPHRHSPVPMGRSSQSGRHASQAMQNLEERWKVPAVQRNVCVREKADSRNVLTQLGAFRRQLQLEHMRMEEKMRESQRPSVYNQMHFRQTSQTQQRHRSS